MSGEAVAAAAAPEEAAVTTEAGLESALYDEGTASDDATETDTDAGTPDPKAEQDATDKESEATNDQDEDESDIEGDDDTPDEDETEEDGFEKRYKDVQAELTTKSQELAELKETYAGKAQEITQARFELRDKLQMVEQTAQHWTGLAANNLQRLQQVNPQSLSQEQYVQWQRDLGMAQQQYQQFNGRLEMTQQQLKKEKDTMLQREVAVARDRLELVIDDFDDTYPKIGAYAVSKGVDREFFENCTDAATIEMWNRLMLLDSDTDAIEEVKTDINVRRKPKQSAEARTGLKRQPTTLAEKLYGSN